MTRILFILFTLTALGFTDDYPKFFAQLGTPLYKADKAFTRLSSLSNMQEKAELYHIEAQKLLHFAENLEKEPKKLAIKRKTYVKRLRALQKVHDEILRIVNANLLKSIDADDYPVFYAIIDSDIDALLDNHVIRKRVMAYYVGHRTRGKLASLDNIYSTLESDTVLKEYVKGHLPKIELIPSAYSSGGSVHKTELSKNEKLAYLADGKHCFKVVDIRDFSSASEFGTYEFPESECSLMDVTVSSDFKYIFLSDLKNGFAILDISYAIAPLLQAQYAKIKARASLATEDGNIVFVVQYERGLSILDITDKEEPRLLANYNHGLSINNIALDEEHSRLYLAHTKGLSVLDISILGNPREVLNFEVEGGSNHIAIADKKRIAYLASQDNGVQVLDISDDNNLTLLSNYQTPHDAHHLTLSKDESALYISSVHDGVHKVDTKDSHYLKHILTYQVDKEASAFSTQLDKDEKNLFISYGEAGLAKVELTQ
jgi:hypothetical protein